MLDLTTHDAPGVRSVPLGLESVIAARITATAWSISAGRSAPVRDHVTSLVSALTARHLSSRTGDAPDWLVQFRDSLAPRLRGPLTLTGLAAEAGVHPVYLARAFRRSFGTPIGRFLRRLRVDTAARMLATTDVPTSTIAFDVGFYDQSHLNRVFVRETGVPPARFRRFARRMRHCR
jgi:AraC family transcriptional regulator